MSLIPRRRKFPRFDGSILYELMNSFNSPEGKKIREHRESFGLTQREAALMVGLSHGSRWAEFEADVRPMDSGRWELFLFKTGLHPSFDISRKYELDALNSHSQKPTPVARDTTEFSSHGDSSMEIGVRTNPAIHPYASPVVSSPITAGASAES